MTTLALLPDPATPLSHESAGQAFADMLDGRAGEAFSGIRIVRAFHREARGVAARTYQERLLGAGLPDDAGFVQRMLHDGAAGAVRAWLLRLDGAAVAYLYCPVRSGDLIYEYVGHDPATAEL